MNEENGSPPQLIEGPLIDEKTIEKIQNAVMQIAAAIMFFFLAAASTATDPFFRKNMGERYLSLLRILISTCGWSAMVYLSYVYCERTTGKTPWFALVSGIIIVIAYVGSAGIQYCTVIRKRRRGEYWHSKSRGESIFGSENAGRDAAIELVAVVSLFFASPLYAAFFFVSRGLGYSSDVIARSILYNKYLDIQDAKIEAQFMEVALREGLAPGRTGGFCPRLPFGVRGEHRTNVAKVVSNGMREIKGFRPPDALQVKSENPPGPTTERRSVDFAEVWKDVWHQTSSFFATLKHWRNFIPSIIFYSAIIVAGVLAYCWHQKHSSIKALAPATSSSPHLTAQNDSPTTMPLFQAKSENTRPMAIAPTAIDVSQTVSVPTKPDPAAVQAALEAQRRKEREVVFQQLTNTMTAQESAFLKFQQDCQTKLNNNTNRIAEVSFSHRGPLRRENDSIRDYSQTVLARQQNFLTDTSQKLQRALGNPQSNLVEDSNQLATVVAAMEKDRQDITKMLDSLDTEIINAPARWHVFGK